MRVGKLRNVWGLIKASITKEDAEKIRRIPGNSKRKVKKEKRKT